jgi:hypothetical protein
MSADGLCVRLDHSTTTVAHVSSAALPSCQSLRVVCCIYRICDIIYDHDVHATCACQQMTPAVTHLRAGVHRGHVACMCLLKATCAACTCSRHGMPTQCMAITHVCAGIHRGACG